LGAGLDARLIAFLGSALRSLRAIPHRIGAILQRPRKLTRCLAVVGSGRLGFSGCVTSSRYRHE